MNQTHHLKLLDEYWEAVMSGRKHFEIRKNDRGYQDGDYVVFHHYSKEPGGTPRTYHYLCGEEYVGTSGRADTMLFRISYVMPLSVLGINSDCVVFGLDEVSHA